MKTELLSTQANDLLQKRLTAYVEALQITCAVLGLDGEWRYDPMTKSLVNDAE